MPDLTTHDFERYFEAVHGHPPFPWQSRLVRAVASEGRWPALLDLPTGTGKTSAIDVALFHLALDPTRAPRRILIVVDRRTIVDQAYERAEKIAAALAGATSGILGNVRERLCGLTGTSVPLALARLRGGMPRDDAWAKRPDQPLVGVSTVDQVGSRLLFRGYGVSDSMRPIHAGLLGHDALILLDEVHLSQPFLETLASVRRFRAKGQSEVPDRWQFVAMSATPGTKEAAFRLDADDEKDERLVRRLSASKPFDPQVVKVSGGEDAKRLRFAEECAKQALAFAKPGRRVGVVVNRVATALEVWRRVSRVVPGAFLVTGRMRPIERDERDRAITSLVRSDRVREPGSEPVVVVATQCIEAGADFDFDDLVTECAALDALRQRFGRLNRLGAIDDARGVVLVRSDAIGADAQDPIYGAALASTWRWIEHGPRDFGIRALEPALPTGHELASLVRDPTRAPVMLPAHLDAWAQTTPIPRPDPDVSLWLHGADRRTEADVNVVWRGDVSASDLAIAGSEGGASDAALRAILDRLDACAPSSLEAVAVPIGAVRAWLDGAPLVEVADMEGETVPDADPRRREEPRRGRSAILWKGEDSKVIDGATLRPGTTIVVPTSYGGLTEGTWDPASTTPPSDLGDQARWKQTRRPVLRLHPGVRGGRWEDLPTPEEDREPEEDRALIDEWLDAVPATESFPDEARQALRSRRSRVVPLGSIAPNGARDPSDRAYFALVARTRVATVARPLAAESDGSDVTTEDDGASYTGVEITLDAHMKGVMTLAGIFAKNCGLPAGRVLDLEIAGRWHDAGKVDPRFQRMLRGGSLLAEISPEPLAKSRLVAADREARERARERSGYPKGARHELASLALLEKQRSLLASAADPELVLHLVASHHGWCRPFAPVVEDPDPVELELVVGADGSSVTASSRHGAAALDSGVAERFWILVERYGWFGLAWLEAILRLADHRRSEEEQASKPAKGAST